MWRVVDRPAFRSLWRGDTDAQHCFTGETIGVDEIFDRDPLRHLTFEVDDAYRLTARLTPAGSGTRLSVSIMRPKDAADDDRAGIAIDLYRKLAIVRRWARMGSAISILPTGS